MHKAIKELVQQDPGDKWGCAMGTYFALADVLYVAGDLVPVAWKYRPGLTVQGYKGLDDMAECAGSELSYDSEHIAALLVAGEITEPDLLQAGNVLSRYTALLDKTGLSY